jgi:hypothetical protein
MHNAKKVMYFQVLSGPPTTLFDKRGASTICMLLPTHPRIFFFAGAAVSSDHLALKASAIRVHVCGLFQSFRRGALTTTGLLLEIHIIKLKKLYIQVLIV